jgi:hypothetical protein
MIYVPIHEFLSLNKNEQSDCYMTWKEVSEGNVRCSGVSYGYLYS